MGLHHGQNLHAVSTRHPWFGDSERPRDTHPLQNPQTCLYQRQAPPVSVLSVKYLKRNVSLACITVIYSITYVTIHTHWNTVSRVWFDKFVTPVCISCRYDIKSTETLFDNATRSRIVSSTQDSSVVFSCIFAFVRLCFLLYFQVAEIISRISCRQTCQTTGEGRFYFHIVIMCNVISTIVLTFRYPVFTGPRSLWICLPSAWCTYKKHSLLCVKVKQFVQRTQKMNALFRVHSQGEDGETNETTDRWDDLTLTV